MCGVVGIIGDEKCEQGSAFWAAYEVYRGLLTLQHRGQDAAGIASFDASYKMFHGHKDLGLVSQVFTEEKLSKLTGHMAIGHNRYATTGSDKSEDLQPMLTGYPFGLSMAHNGNIVNYHRLRQKLVNEHQVQMMTNNDLELLMHLWCLKFQYGDQESDLFGQMKEAAESIMKDVEGGFAVTGMMAGAGLFAMRDPDGLRPLVLGRKELAPNRFSYCFASETLTLNFLGYELVRDVRPGEIVLIDFDGQIKSHLVGDGLQQGHHCMFEWIYFAAAESSLEERSVYGSRLKLGLKLADKIRPLLAEGSIEVDIVCPVPDTSRSASISLAENLAIPYREGLIKNRYVQRSFILKSQEAREKAVELKLSPVRSEIMGKNILLVDDSIVRGTTSKKIIGLLKKYGAKKITLAITSPPLRYGCFYGIDFPNDQDLMAHGKEEEEIARLVGAHRVIYLDEQDLKDCIGLDGLCMGCVNGLYPTPLTDADEFSRRRNEYR